MTFFFVIYQLPILNTFTDVAAKVMAELMVEIVTERLLLRPAMASDLGDLHSILSHEAATTFWSTPPHEDMAATEAWLDAMMSIDPQEGEDFVIELDGRVIGKAGLYQFPEVGFILHPEVWGKGYAQEALRPVLDRAFSVYNLPSVEADVDPRNTPSLRVLNRLGFAEVGRKSRTWHVGGEWCDSVYLRLDDPKSIVR